MFDFVAYVKNETKIRFSKSASHRDTASFSLNGNAFLYSIER